MHPCPTKNKPRKFYYSLSAVTIFRTIARQSIQATPPDSSPVLPCARASTGVSGGGEKYNAKIISALARHSRGKSAYLTQLTLSG